MSANIKLLSLALLSGGILQAADNKPNVLIVYTDEHNFRTLESYLPLMGEAQRHPWGDNVPLKTPNIKYLSDNGVIMNNCYVTTPVSTPSRASLMTGLYPQKTNCTNNNHILDATLKMMPEVFAENGYSTGYAGKWHLSGGAKPGWTPTPNYGWEQNKYMFNRGHWKSILDNPTGENPLLGSNESELKSEYDIMTEYLTVKAQEFILKEKNNPFIFLLSIPDPHGPDVASPPYFNMYKDYEFLRPATASKNMSLYPSWAAGNVNLGQNTSRNYWGMVKCIDDNVGKLITTLRDNNLLDKTIIIFTSDHGDMCGEHGRVNKGIPLEGSLKVPFIVYAPNLLPKNKVVQEAVSNIDIFPTLVELCGLSNMPVVDGISIAPLMRGDEGAVGRNCVFSRSVSVDQGWLCVSTDRYKLVHSTIEGDVPWLIDKQVDPDELLNFYNNSAYTNIQATLQESLIGYCENNAEPRFKFTKIRLEFGLEPLDQPGTPVGGTTPPIENILKNGDFEQVIEGTSLPLNWAVTQDPSFAKSVIIEDNGLNGSKGLKMGKIATVMNCSFSQELPVEEGVTYTFYGYCYYSAVPSDDNKAIISVYSLDDTEIATYEIPATGTFGSKPTVDDVSIIRSFDFIPDADVDNIILKIESNGIDKLIRFDNLMLGKKDMTSAVSKAYARNGIVVKKDRIVLESNVNYKSVKVFNMSGRLVMSNSSGNNIIYLNNLSKGIYIVKGGTVTGEILVKKLMI